METFKLFGVKIINSNCFLNSLLSKKYGEIVSGSVGKNLFVTLELISAHADGGPRSPSAHA